MQNIRKSNETIIKNNLLLTDARTDRLIGENPEYALREECRINK